MIRIGDIVDRVRSKADNPVVGKNILSQDGTNYTIVLAAFPIVSGTDEVYIRHSTFTTGLNQFVYRNLAQSNAYASGNNFTYTIDYSRGEIYPLQGSGTVVANTGLRPFAPWNTSVVTVYYESSIYTDDAIARHVSYAVAGVEAAIQIGMYVSGILGTSPPNPRNMNDKVDYKASDPYAATEKFVIAEDLEIIQELIAKKASLDIATRERRIGAGDAIRIKDGDTEIDTAVNQRYVRDQWKDLESEYKDMIKWVMYNMLDGYSIRQINERYMAMGGRMGNYTTYEV